MALGVPVINIAHFGEQIPGVDVTIMTDGCAIGEMAAKHFLGRGFRQFAYCSYDDLFWSQERGASFSKKIENAGFKTNFFKQTKSYIQDAQRDEQPFIIAHNERRVGYDAAELLDKLISGKKIDDNPIVIRPTHVVTRQSTDSLAVENRYLTQALRYIRQQAKEPIQIRNVVESTTLSRRSLELPFCHVLARSIHEEILRNRIELICQMLVETDLAVSQISLALEYSDSTHMARMFRKAMDMTHRI